jgi:NADPH2:quinone reductase
MRGAGAGKKGNEQIGVRVNEDEERWDVKAIVVERTGGPEVLRISDVRDPQPGAGQVRVRVEAVGVNFIEIYQRTGLYPVTLPATPGGEAAGVVEQVGAGVTDLAEGDRIAWTGVPGAYAERALVPTDRAVRLPDGIDTKTGAAVMLQGMTAHYLAHSIRPLGEGDACLVHAAAGGVGLLLCQLCRRAGARVIGTASTAAKAALARAAGAAEVILYGETDFEVEVRRLTNGVGVDVVYDSVGRTTFEKSLRSLARRGTLVLFGQSSGPVPAFDPQLLNRHGSLFFTRPSLAHYIATRDELQARARDILGWVADGSLRVRVGGEYPLADAARAHHDLESRATSGKLLLIP